jgi:hypothetical protein
MQTLSGFLLLLFFLSSCSRIPEPIDYNHSVQQKMQAAQHWEVLADDVANKINHELIRKDLFDTALYVKTTCGDENTPCAIYETSPFNEAFRDLLITGLVNFGIPTRQIPDEKSIIVNYKVQIVRHNAKRFRTIQPGLITSLTAAVLVLRNAPDELLTLAGAGLVDYANQSLVKNDQYEVIITSSMIKQGEYLFRSSDIYYINDTDFIHYLENVSPAKEIPLSAPVAMEKPPQKAVIEPQPLTEETTVIQSDQKKNI